MALRGRGEAHGYFFLRFLKFLKVFAVGEFFLDTFRLHTMLQSYRMFLRIIDFFGGLLRNFSCVKSENKLGQTRATSDAKSFSTGPCLIRDSLQNLIVN